MQRNAKEINHELKKQLDRAIIDCIARDSRPFNDFRKPGILNYIENIFSINKIHCFLLS